MVEDVTKIADVIAKRAQLLFREPKCLWYILETIQFKKGLDHVVSKNRHNSQLHFITKNPIHIGYAHPLVVSHSI